MSQTIYVDGEKQFEYVGTEGQLSEEEKAALDGEYPQGWIYLKGFRSGPDTEARDGDALVALVIDRSTEEFALFGKALPMLPIDNEFQQAMKEAAAEATYWAQQTERREAELPKRQPGEPPIWEGKEEFFEPVIRKARENGRSWEWCARKMQVTEEEMREAWEGRVA